MGDCEEKVLGETPTPDEVEGGEELVEASLVDVTSVTVEVSPSVI